MNEHVVDLLALYALDGLEPDERAMVEAHLATCAACRAEAEREAALVGVLAASLPEVKPDPRLRAATLARVGIKSAPPPRSRPVQPAPARDPRPGWLTLPRWVPVAFSVVMAVLAGWNVFLTGQINTLNRQLQGSTQAMAIMANNATTLIQLAAADGTGAEVGHAYVSDDSQNVVLVVEDLDPLATNQTYQAWLITDNGPQSAGLFSVTPTGWGMTELTIPFTPGAAIGVSREPAGGSAAPTDVVLLGGL
jgi:anti-sigma factor RsiW